MKTWEMIKELTENPKKEFVLKNDRRVNVFMTVGGEVCYEVDGCDIVKLLKLDGWLLKQEWEEVKKPVGFMDVLKQAKKDNAKLFTIKNPEHDVNFTKQPLYFILSYLSSTCTDDLLADILLNSEWYIEDDEND